jgi:hypothetical protein
MEQRIMRFIDEALAARGFNRVSTGGDLLVSYTTKVTEEQQLNTFWDGVGPGWGWGSAWGWNSGFSTTTIETIYHGTLIVDMVDANRKKLVFQGIATDTISSKPQKNTQRYARAVSEIFEHYPPQP